MRATEPTDFLAARRARLAARRGIDSADVGKRLVARTEARKAKDFVAADAIRDELLALGVEVLDTATGVDWRVRESS